jgi:excisionase family DNA binding protein
MTSDVDTARPARAELFADGAVTVAEAVRFSGIGRTHLYDLMTAGRIAFVKIGSRRLIARRGLIDLLAGGADPDAAA